MHYIDNGAIAMELLAEDVDGLPNICGAETINDGTTRLPRLSWAEHPRAFPPVSEPPMSEVSRTLSAIARGDPRAAEKLLPLVYEELRKLAAQRLAQEKSGQTLQATALVHEAYLSLVVADRTQHWKSRGHFFAAAAMAMRHILIDNARRKLTNKHGGNSYRQPLESLAAPAPDDELLALDEALKKLGEQEPEKARLVELRYFAGLTGEQAAEVLGISPTTADRHWAYARAWLGAQIRGR
jgi:RNA polymerase sigma factor (TIGR02999 family)